MPQKDAGELTVARHRTLMEAQTDREMVGLHIDSGTCFGFNATAYRVWQLIEQPTTLSQLCRTLSGEFDIDPATCALDVHAMLKQLAQDGLVTLSSEA
jgi:hypothetical protein